MALFRRFLSARSFRHAKDNDFFVNNDVPEIMDYETTVEKDFRPRFHILKADLEAIRELWQKIPDAHTFSCHALYSVGNVPRHPYVVIRWGPAGDAADDLPFGIEHGFHDEEKVFLSCKDLGHPSDFPE
jgi:hypothetical protein